MKKYIFGAVLSIGLLVSPAFTQAAGLTSSQIQAILSLLSSFGAEQSIINNVQASLTGGTPTAGGQSFCHNFNSDLTGGSNGDDVVALNQALSSSGINTTGNSSSFSENNAGDVVSFQAKYGIRQTGYVGPLTRAKLNALYGCHGMGYIPSPTLPPQPIATTCPTFPPLRPDYCSGGTLVPHGPDANGCQVLPTCVTPSAQPSVTVLSPNGGETWTKGTSQAITWQDSMTNPQCLVGTTCLPRAYDINLVPPGVPSCAGSSSSYVCPMVYLAPFTIAKGVYGSSYTWSVGATLDHVVVPSGVGTTAPYGSYTVQVCQSGTSVCDSSDQPFKITSYPGGV